MKKMIIFMLCSILLFGMLSCQLDTPNAETTAEVTEADRNETTAEIIEEITTAQEEEVTTEETTEETTEKTEATGLQNCIVHIQYQEIEKFLQDEWEAKYGQNGYAEVNNQNSSFSLIVPMLKRSDYEFIYLEVRRQYKSRELDVIYFVFGPKEREKYDEFEYPKEFIYIKLFMRPGTFDEFIESNEFKIENGRLFHAGTWFIDIEDNIDGNCMEIQFPNSLKIEYKDTKYIPFEMVEEFFDFEMMSYSPNAENNVTQ